MSVKSEINELLESWWNGNRKYVVEQVVKKPKLKAIQMAIDLTVRMSPEDNDVFKLLVCSYKKPT